MNFFSKTEYESLQDAKENYKSVMPILRGLDHDEVETLLHKIRNSGRNLGDNLTDELLTEQTFHEIE